MANDELTTNESQARGIESYLVGRLPIYTSIERFDPDNTGEITAEVNEALSIHAENLIAMEELYW